MNIVRMCMIVGMWWLLVAQAGAHAMEQKASSKAKKSMRELVMEYLPYVGYAGTVLGICGTWHGHYIAKSAQEQIKFKEMAFESERGLIFDRLGKVLCWRLAKKELVVSGYSNKEGVYKLNLNMEGSEKFGINPGFIEFIKQYANGVKKEEELEKFISEYKSMI